MTDDGQVMADGLTMEILGDEDLLNTPAGEAAKKRISDIYQLCLPIKKVMIWTILE